MAWFDIVNDLISSTNIYARRSNWDNDEKAYFKRHDCDVKLIRKDANGRRKPISGDDLRATDWELVPSSL